MFAYWLFLLGENSMKEKKFNWNYLLIAPALIISVCIILVPGVMTFVFSFTDWNGLSPNINFIGLKNFIELFQEKVFYKAIMNNVIWTLLFLTVPVCIGCEISGTWFRRCYIFRCKFQ